MADKITRSPGSNSGPSQRRASRILVAVAIGFIFVLLSLAAALYVERARVATLLVQRYLADYGIESRIEFDRLTWSEFRLRFSAGPANSPDFSADGIDVTLVYPADGLMSRITPRIAAVRLIRPALRLSYDGKTLSFGSLQPLVNDLLSGEAGGTSPDVVIDSGSLILTTPNGIVTMITDASIAGGRLTNLKASLQPGSLRGPSFAANIASGTAEIEAIGEALNATAALTFNSASFKDKNARAIDVALDIPAVTWRQDGDGFRFTMRGADITLETAEARTADAAVTASKMRIALEGIDGHLASGQLRTAGRIDVSSDFTGARIGQAQLAFLNVQGSSPSLSVNASQNDWSLSGPMQIALDARDARYPTINGDVTLAEFKAEVSGSGSATENEAKGVFRGTASASGNLPGSIALRSARMEFDGSGEIGNQEQAIVVQTSLMANGSMPRAASLDLVRGIPGLGADDTFASSIADALQSTTLTLENAQIAASGRSIVLKSASAATLQGASGTTLAIKSQGTLPLMEIGDAASHGAFALDLYGGRVPELHLAVSNYRYRPDVSGAALDATARFAVSLDLDSVHGLQLAGTSRLQIASERVRLYLPDCTEARFDSFLGGGQAVLGGAKARICATMNRPIFESGPRGWQIAAGWSDVSATLPSAEIAVTGGRGILRLTGESTEIAGGRIDLEQARIADLTSQPRFAPIAAGGSMQASDATWHGELKVSSSANRPLATVALSHSLNTNEGEAIIDARGLTFEPNGLQPANIAPYLSSFAAQVRGRADFTGRISWSGGAIASDGRLVLTDTTFRSAIGQVQQVNADLALDSLVPVVLHSQTVTAAQVDLVVPLQRVSAQFTYTPEALQLESATASMADGRITLDPLAYNFAPGATTMGTLHLDDVDVTELIAAAGLADRVSTTARIDGAVPFTWGPGGVRFANGRVHAVGPGRLSISRQALGSVGIGGAAAAPPNNAVQDFAYQALENMAFDTLEGTVNSLPMGRLGIQLHLTGRHDPPESAEARVGALDFLRGRAFDKPIPLPKGTPVNLTLDTSLNLDELLESYFNRGGNAEAAAQTRAQ